MKKPFLIYVTFFLMFVTGCSILKNRDRDVLIGTWLGIHSSGAEVVIEFQEFSMVDFKVLPNYVDYWFSGYYRADISKNPGTLDFYDVRADAIAGNMFYGIIRFTDDHEMELYGTFGNSGQLKRPEKIDIHAELPSVYILLKKD